MRFFRLALAAVLSAASLYPAAVALAQEAQPEQRGVELTQEHIEILRQIAAQLTPEQRESLKQLPPEKQKLVMLGLLQRALQQQKPEPVKEWIGPDENPLIEFMERDRYQDTAERIEDFIHEKTERRVEIVAIGFIRDGHDHFFKYRRLYRAKYKTRSGKQYMADFLLEKQGPYMQVIEWRRVDEQEG